MRLYVQGLPSYRVLSVLLEQRLGRPVGRATLNGWVDELGGRAKSPVEVSAELRPPSWSGFLGVDGKAIFVAGKEAALVVGVDQGTHDVVHAVVAEFEGEEAFERLVREAITEAGYPLEGLVMDAAPPFLAAHANYFARAPLQLCRIHASRRLDFTISKATRSPDAPLRAELKDRVRAVLFAPTQERARRLFRGLLADRDRYEGLGRRDTLGAMERSFDLYMTHHRVEGMPADTNITENVIKQLGKKLRLMEGFASLESAERFSRAPGRLLPLQAVHRLLPARQRQVTVADGWSRDRRDRVAPLSPPPVTFAQQHSTGRCRRLPRRDSCLASSCSS